MKAKKSLAGTLATILTINGLGSLLAATSFSTNNSLLTSPVSAIESNQIQKTKKQTDLKFLRFLLEDPDLKVANGITNSIWERTGKGIISEIINRKIDDRSADGVNVYNASVNLGGGRLQSLKAIGKNRVQATLVVSGNNAAFRSNAPCQKFSLLNCNAVRKYADPSFRVGFDLTIELDLLANDDRIELKHANVSLTNFHVRNSSFTDTLAKTISNLFNDRAFSREISNELDRKHFKESLNTSLKDALDRF